MLRAYQSGMTPDGLDCVDGNDNGVVDRNEAIRVLRAYQSGESITPAPEPDPVVQVIYAIPSDRQHDTRYEDAIEGAILHVQDWYADQLDGRTFAIEDPTPLVCAAGEASNILRGGGRMEPGIGGCPALRPGPTLVRHAHGG